MAAEKSVGFRIQIKGTPQQQAEIERLERAVSILATRRRVLNKNERDGNITTTQAARVRGRLNLQLKAQRNRLNDLNRSVLQNNNALRKNSGFVSGITKGIGGFLGPAALATAGFALLSKTIGAAVGIFRDFQKENSNLAAVLGTNRAGIKDLTDDAKRLGASTQFTATEVSKLQTEFAKLGFSQKEILKTTEATLDLAAVARVDLAEAATVAGSTVRAFGLQARDTGEVVDIMSKSFSASSLDISKFQTAIGSVGPIAKSAGQDLALTTAQLGTLTDAGIEASTAGTGLKGVLLEVAKQGITLDQALVKIQGSTNKNATALELFGKRGAVVGTVLAENTVRTAALEKELRNAAGTAQEMADTQLDNLAGAMTKMSSAWEGLILSIEDGEGAISTALQNLTETTTGFLSTLAALNELDFSDIEGSIKSLASALEDILPGVEGIAEEIEKIEEERAEQSEKRANDFLKLDKEFQDQVLANVRERSRADIKASIEATGEEAFNLQKRIKDNQAFLEEIARLRKERSDAAVQAAIEDAAAASLAAEAGQQDAEKFAKLRLEIERQLQDVSVQNQEEGLERSLAIEQLRFERSQEDLNKKFAGQKELNELLIQLEIDHSQRVDAIRQGDVQKQEKANEEREESLREQMEEELALEMEALQAKRDLRQLEIEQMNIDEEERNQLTLEADIEFNEQQLELKRLFGDQDIALQIELEQQKRDLDDDTTQKKLDNAAKVISTIQKGTALLTQFLSVQESNRLKTFDRNAQSQLDIFKGTEEEKKSLERKLTAEREQIQRKFFRTQQGLSVLQAGLDGAAAVVKGIAMFGPPPSLAGIAAIVSAGITTAAQIAIIASKKFGRGGIPKGPSHKQGGIPFSVGGVPGEMEGGEAIINKRSTGMFKPLLSRINQAGGGVAFEYGGVTPQRMMAQAGTLLPTVGVASGAAETTQDIAEQSAQITAEVLAEAINDQEVTVSEQVITDTQKEVEVNEALGDF